MTNFEKVKQFHAVFCPEQNAEELTEPNYATRRLREDLIREEFEELMVGFYRSTVPQETRLVAVADAIADLLYVVYGTAAVYGIDADAVFDEVHRSNMIKAEPCRECGACLVGSFAECEGPKILRRDDGKVIKGDCFIQPRIKEVLGLA